MLSRLGFELAIHSISLGVSILLYSILEGHDGSSMLGKAALFPHKRGISTRH